MESREWVYESPSWNSKGVTLTDAGLQWWESGHSFIGGASSDQSLEDFLQNGPVIAGLPAELVAELKIAVRERINAIRTT